MSDDDTKVDLGGESLWVLGVTTDHKQLLDALLHSHWHRLDREKDEAMTDEEVNELIAEMHVVESLQSVLAGAQVFSLTHEGLIDLMPEEDRTQLLGILGDTLNGLFTFAGLAIGLGPVLHMLKGMADDEPNNSGHAYPDLLREFVDNLDRGVSISIPIEAIPDHMLDELQPKPF